MVTAWYIDESENPTQVLSLEQIQEYTGVVLYRLNIDTLETDGEIDAIRKERGYGYQDVLEISRASMPDYENRVKGFFREHQHPEEEIRMIIKGTVYIDVRDREDHWVRLHVTPGDLMVLPPGIYHRTRLIQETPDYAVYRLFKHSPVWTSYNREPDSD